MRIIGYILVLVIGLFLAVDFTDTDASPSPSNTGEEETTSGLNEGFEFIQSRSNVTYRIMQDEYIREILRWFHLRLKDEAILNLNRHLDRDDLKERIPKGAEVKLFIQAKQQPFERNNIKK